MKRQINRSFCVFVISIFLIHSGAKAQALFSDVWTKERASQWFSKGQWLNGLNLKAYEAIDQVEFAIQYHKNKKLWDKAFTYLKQTNLDSIAPGKYLIAGDSVYASVTAGPTKDFENTKWEAHKKYIDIQYVIKGNEKMGKAPVSLAKVITPYDETKDVAFYDVSQGKFYEALPGTFLIFFPKETHRPGIKMEGCDKDKKVVIKIMAN